MKKEILCGTALVLILGSGWLRGILSAPGAQASADWSQFQPDWIIDAGHGGEDGGAVSLTGVPESQINLSIAQRLDVVLSFCGQRVQMLREDDRSLHDLEARTLREKKVSDLHNRAYLVEEAEDATLVSIHQNSFPRPQYHGAQVFYAPTDGSQSLAVRIQNTIHQCLQPDNTREAKPIEKTVYLMNHVTCPAVLVECGFLSNPQEEKALQEESYQLKIAMALTGSCLQEKTGVPLQAGDNLIE